MQTVSMRITKYFLQTNRYKNIAIVTAGCNRIQHKLQRTLTLAIIYRPTDK